MCHRFALCHFTGLYVALIDAESYSIILRIVSGFGCDHTVAELC